MINIHNTQHKSFPLFLFLARFLKPVWLKSPLSCDLTRAFCKFEEYFLFLWRIKCILTDCSFRLIMQKYIGNQISGLIICHPNHRVISFFHPLSCHYNNKNLNFYEAVWITQYLFLFQITLLFHLTSYNHVFSTWNYYLHYTYQLVWLCVCVADVEQSHI